MAFRLRPDWRRTLRTWSVWLLFSSVLADGVQIGLQVLVDHDWLPWSPLVGAGMLLVLNTAAFIARFIAQHDLKKDAN